MSELPDGWEWSTLGELCDLVRGVSFKKGESSTSEAPGTLPIIRAGNLSDAGIDFENDLVWVPPERVSSEQRLRQGDIVVATSSGSIKVVGKSVHLRTDWNGAHGAFMSVIRPDAGIDPAFAGWYVRSPRVRSSWSTLAKGTNINNLKKGHLEDTPIPVAPLPEQRRIVAAIEEHLSRLEAAEADLKAAVERTVALVDAGYQAILREPGNLVRLASVCATSSGGTPSRRRPDFYEGAIPWIKSGELEDGPVTEIEEMISAEALEGSSAKMFPENTILMAMYGATIGKMGRVPDGGAATNQAIAAFFPNDELSDEYLWAVLRAKRRELKNSGKGGAQPNISQTVLRELEFPLPERGDQVAAASHAQQVEETAIVIHEDLKVALRRSRSLRRAILAAAFSGQLVPQDPSDEPASALLERIAAERAAPKPSRKKKAAS